VTLRAGQCVAWCTLALCVVAGGCAYTASTLLPTHIKTISIPVARNTTERFGLDQTLTNALLTAYTRDNHLRVVSGGAADAELTTTISRYRNEVFSYTAGNQPSEYQVSISVSVVFVDRVKNHDLWRNDAVTASARYSPGDAPGPTGGQAHADSVVVQKIADDVVAKTIQGW
jgi:ethanolamine utilization microcompartment shell protein EutL